MDLEKNIDSSILEGTGSFMIMSINVLTQISSILKWAWVFGKTLVLAVLARRKEEKEGGRERKEDRVSRLLSCLFDMVNSFGPPQIFSTDMTG